MGAKITTSETFILVFDRKRNKRTPDYWDIPINKRAEAYMLHNYMKSILLQTDRNNIKGFFRFQIRILGNLLDKMPLV